MMQRGTTLPAWYRPIAQVTRGRNFPARTAKSALHDLQLTYSARATRLRGK
jgi:hypothetical protein